MGKDLNVDRPGLAAAVLFYRAARLPLGRDWFRPGTVIIDRGHSARALIGKRTSSPTSFCPVAAVLLALVTTV